MTAHYDDGEAKRATELGRAVECDYCGLRYALWMLGTDTACSECAVSRLARIRACHQRLTRGREVDHVVDEEVGGLDEELPL